MKNFKLLYYSTIFISVISLFFACSKEILTVNKMEGKSYTSSRSNIEYDLNDYKIWQINNTVVTVIFPIRDTDKNHIWLVQSQNPHVVDLMSTLTNVNFGAYNKNYLKLSYDNMVLVYLLTGSTLDNYTSNAVGLIKLENQDLLKALRTLNENTRNDIIDDVQAKARCKDNPTGTTPKTPDEECKCAGGYGATGCECGGSALSVSWHESVTCGTGMYACCSGL